MIKRLNLAVCPLKRQELWWLGEEAGCQATWQQRGLWGFSNFARCMSQARSRAPVAVEHCFCLRHMPGRSMPDSTLARRCCHEAKGEAPRPQAGWRVPGTVAL